MTYSFLEAKAFEVVDEMASLGAVFGASYVDGYAVWSWEAKPPIMRNAIVNYLNSVAELDDDGFGDAMVSAILRSVAPAVRS